VVVEALLPACGTVVVAAPATSRSGTAARPANPVSCPGSYQGLLSSGRRRDLVLVDVAALRADPDEAIGHINHGVNYGSV